MNESLIKKRKIAIKGLKDQSCSTKVIESLSQKEGMIAVGVDNQKEILRVEYDLKKITFETIEKSIKELGFKLSQRIKEKLKRGMAKFTEQNELDNFSDVSASCCIDPKEKIKDCRSLVTESGE